MSIVYVSKSDYNLFQVTKESPTRLKVPKQETQKGNQTKDLKNADTPDRPLFEHILGHLINN